MFDWNGNSSTIPDDFVTFGLLEDMINDEDEMPSAKNRNRRNHHPL